MPQFAYAATDSRGNRVEGSLAAPDMTVASYQLREMGYTPLSVTMVAEETDVTAAMPPMADAPSRPGPLDLTQTVTEYPASANSLLGSLSDADDEIAQPLQPWERGGQMPETPIAPAPDAMSAVGRTQPMSAAGLNGAVPQSPTPPLSAPGLNGAAALPRPLPVGPRPGALPKERTPYSGGIPDSTPWERFKEVFLYPIRSGVVVKDLVAFYRQFSTLIDAGLPIFQALVALEANTQNAKLKEVARAGARQVQAGGRFSEVMSAYPWIFPPMHIQMVRAAEQGGMLDEMLDDLSAYVEHELAMKRLIKQETFYPKLVLFFAVMILGKPGFFEALPAFSKWVLGSMGKAEYTTGSYLADTVGFALTMLVPIFAVVVVFRVFLYNRSGVREAYDTIKTTLPGLGNIVKMFVMAKFMRVYAALYRAGFSMSSTLEIAGESCGNVLMRNAARRAIPLVERGGLVSEALARSGFMPAMAVDMFRTGETTGGMDQMLSKMADYYEAEAKLKSHQLALIFSAAVFLTVAFLVGMAVIRFWSGYATGVSSQG